MATKKKKSARPRAPRKVTIKTSLAASDIWANNAALRQQQNRENDILRSELRNQGLEQKLLLQSLKADVERDKLFYKRLADLGDQRAAVSLRDIEQNSVLRAADARPNVMPSLSPEARDSVEAYDLAFSPMISPALFGKRGNVKEYLRQITRNQAETERRLATPQKVTMPASEAPIAATQEQLGTPRQPAMVSATPAAVQNPFLTPTPPRSRNTSKSNQNTPHVARIVTISENPHAVSQKNTGAPTLTMFGGAAR